MALSNSQYDHLMRTYEQKQLDNEFQLRKRYEKAYALIPELSWLLVGIGVLILDIFPQLIKTISEKIGIVSPVNMLFFFGFCFSLIIIFVLTIAVSKLSIKIKQLAQQIAIYEKKEKERRQQNEVEGK